MNGEVKMLNIEKYKNFVMKNLNYCQMETDMRKEGSKETIDCAHTLCEDCKESFFKWLLSEYKEPVLDDKEREYLSYGIRPFREKIECIYKHQMSYMDAYYIVVRLKDGDSLMYPRFKGNIMYKGMEVEKEYTLEELGL